MNKKLSNKILSILSLYYGNVEPDLNFENMYQLIIAVVLSAQTTDKQVNIVTAQLFKDYPGFIELSKAKVEEVEYIIKSIGFFRNKSKNIINLSKDVVEKFSGNIPDKMEDLIKLPGVGRKSANVVLSIGYNFPAIAVDTHVLRISNRLGYISSDNPDKVESALKEIIDEKKWIMTHLLFIKHGRMICKARGPLCEKCPISKQCKYFLEKFNDQK
jgi:endonuclease III